MTDSDSDTMRAQRRDPPRLSVDPTARPGVTSKEDRPGPRLVSERPAARPADTPGNSTREAEKPAGDSESARERSNDSPARSDKRPKASDEPAKTVNEKPQGETNVDAPLPKFRSYPASVEGEAGAATARTNKTAQVKLWEAFTPSRPKYSSRFFAGRHSELQRVITAIEEEQNSIIIYGPRGIGKTSLSNIIAESAKNVGYRLLRFPCSSDTTYEDIFRGFLRGIPAECMDRATRAKFPEVQSLDQFLPAGEFGPTELVEALVHLKLDHAVMMLDEFDRVEDSRLNVQLAETIKNLSDASARVTLVIIGIARSLEELVGLHPSIQRHLSVIHLRLMEPAEMRRMIEAGEEAAGLRFDEETRDMIVSFSKGLPYYAQLLALHAGRIALDRGTSVVEIGDLRPALRLVLEEQDPVVKASYERATKDESNSFLIDVLYAAAAARFDKFGNFTAENAAKVAINEEGKTIPAISLHKALSALAQRDGNPIIEKWRTPSGKTLYGFVLQTMRQYILLRQAAHRRLA